MKVVPGRGQSLAEMALDVVRVNIAEDLLGKKDGKRFLPLLTTIFFTTLAMNIPGIIPGIVSGPRRRDVVTASTPSETGVTDTADAARAALGTVRATETIMNAIDSGGVMAGPGANAQTVVAQIGAIAVALEPAEDGFTMITRSIAG